MLCGLLLGLKRNNLLVEISPAAANLNALPRKGRWQKDSLLSDVKEKSRKIVESEQLFVAGS